MIDIDKLAALYTTATKDNTMADEYRVAVDKALPKLLAEVRALRSRMSMATQFKLWQPSPYSTSGWIEIHRCEGHRLPKQPCMWAVRMDGFTLSKSGEWEYEPIPSSRDDAYYARCRYDSYEDAETMARKAIRAAKEEKP